MKFSKPLKEFGTLGSAGEKKGVEVARNSIATAGINGGTRLPVLESFSRSTTSPFDLLAAVDRDGRLLPSIYEPSCSGSNKQKPTHQPGGAPHLGRS